MNKRTFKLIAIIVFLLFTCCLSFFGIVALIGYGMAGPSVEHLSDAELIQRHGDESIDSFDKL